MDLNLPPSLIGRKTQPCLAEVVRGLTEADIALLATERGIQPSNIKKLTDNHHALARVLAQGMKDADAAAITGYTPSRISVLRDSPLFAELIEHYRENKDAAFADLHERMVNVGLVAVQELAERLENEPEKIGTATILEAIKTLADRTGHGPQTKSTNINVNLSLASRVAEGRRRAMSTQAALPRPDALGPEGARLPAASLPAILSQPDVDAA